MPALVCAVSSASNHDFSKSAVAQISLLEGLGVAGDAHCGATVKHRSRVAKNPQQPNLRQVHLIQSELFSDLAARGHAVAAGQMGENITTSGIDLLALPVDTVLRIGPHAVVRLTGLRNPCWQLDKFQPGLMTAVLGRDAGGKLVRKAGVMGVVQSGGTVKPGDSIEISYPPAPHRTMDAV